MTSYVTREISSPEAAVRGSWLAVAAGAAMALALTTLGTFAGAVSRHDAVVEYLIVVGVIAATAAIVGWVAGWALRGGEQRIARTALVLALLAVVSFFVAYLGLPAVLAAGAAALAVIGARREERWRASSAAALVLAATAPGLAILFAMGG